MISENARQSRADGTHSLARIYQGRQSDPKESNALLHPIMEQPAESGFTRLARNGEDSAANEEIKRVREESAVQRAEPQLAKEEPVIRRDEPGVRREDKGSVDGYGLNSVKVHDSNSRSSKDRERRPPAKKAARSPHVNP
eukprot:TRINITY_DN2951_c0_g1_i5.p3 TRINITY_DN2951_c0_g1~~TRINITY_DN2951_c0_g1_i5.p3  ORF type:complete len:140 (+),score=45.50 TRINITY_DN2951_c0_g1_i5:926-1345(+)